MWGTCVFRAFRKLGKCSNFLGGHFVFLKCCEFCTDAMMPGVNTFSGGCSPKTTGYLYSYFVISQPQSSLTLRNILALFDKVMVSEVCMLPNGKGLKG